MDYILERSNRKTVSLTVKNKDVLVKAPLYTSKNEIDKFVQSHKKWIEKRLADNTVTPLNKELTDKEEEFLKESARVYLSERLSYYSSVMGLKHTGMKITGARHRYGSCNAKNGICFSFRLMLYPKEAIDYVVVHELAHIKEKNHGRGFYALVRRYMPDYKIREKILKTYKEK